MPTGGQCWPDHDRTKLLARTSHSEVTTPFHTLAHVLMPLRNVIQALHCDLLPATQFHWSYEK